MGNYAPKFNTSIVNVFANETPPDTFLAKLLSENKSAFGMAVREPTGIVVEKFPKIENGQKAIDLLKDITSNTKKFPVMFCFHAFPAEFDEDEVQPYTILKDGKNNPILCVAVEGDFPNYAGDEEGYSEAYKLVNDWLGPKIEGIYSLVGNNPTKTIEYLKGAQFASDFKKEFGFRASLSFMPSQGDPFTIEKNELGLKATWGDASQAYGYTEAAIAAATVEEKPVEQPRKASKYATDPAPAETKPPAPVPQSPSVPQVPAQPAKTPAEQVAKEMVEVEMDWTPPASLHGKKLKEAYRQNNNGILVTNWQDRPTIKIKVKKPLTLPDKTASTTTTTNTPVANDKGVYTMPVISGEKQKAINEVIQKRLGDGSAVIKDPKEAQKTEEKLAKFTELFPQHFKNIRGIEKLKTEFLFFLGKEHYEAVVLALIEARAEIRRLDDIIASNEKTLGELAGDKTQATTSPVNPPSTPSPDPVKEPVVPAATAPKKSKYA